jgi:transcriptional regulator with XRE-family HTH domain
MNSNSPDPVDLHVGGRIRLQRKLIGQSQQALADALGVTFQQVQKYERGTNRISASMMAKAARSQGVVPSFYFDGLNLDGAEEPVPEEMRAAVAWLRSADAVPLAQSLVRLPPSLRGAVLNMARSLEGVAP